jgi:hypothetical protein
MEKVKIKNVYKIEREKHLKVLEKEILAALKGEDRENIRTACNRVANNISGVLSREKEISRLQNELDALKSKNKR